MERTFSSYKKQESIPVFRHGISGFCIWYYKIIFRTLLYSSTWAKVVQMHGYSTLVKSRIQIDSTQVLWKREVWPFHRLRPYNFESSQKFRFAPVHGKSTNSGTKILISTDQLIWVHNQIGLYKLVQFYWSKWPQLRGSTNRNT